MGVEGEANFGKDPDLERKEHLDEISRLLAKVIEKGSEFSPQKRAGMRQQIQAHLKALGLVKLDPVALSTITQELDRKLIKIPTPSNYPDEETFRQDLNSALVAKPRRSLTGIPPYPKVILAAEYGQADWQAVRGGGEVELEDYLYDLGKIMGNQYVYTTLFGESDPIVVGENWQIENGRHRVLALKALGPEYIALSGMERWVAVERESG